MNQTAVIAGVVILLAIVGMVVYRSLRQTGGFGGFRDWVKNPDFSKAAAEYFAARDALEVPDDISEAEIRQMVDRLFVQQDNDFNMERLKLVGDKADALLIEALEDPKTAETKFGAGGHALDAKSPFERIVDLLDAEGPVAAALPLARYIDHEDSHFRKYAAIALGNIGTADCVAPMLTALDDDDDYVRSFAMMGIERGVSDGRCTDEFLSEMFSPLTKLLSRDSMSGTDEAPKLLLAIDSDRALTVLLSAEYFHVENSNLSDILEALNEVGRPIPHDRLLPLLKILKPLATEFPYDRQYAAALEALARHPNESAEQLLQQELDSANEHVQRGAAEALAMLSGIDDAHGVVFDALEKRGFEGLSKPQQHYFAAFIYDVEVNNGGHSQYFVNSSGDAWERALEGLELIGAADGAAILRDATQIFGADGPSVDRERRHQELAGFSSRQDQLLEEMDSRYYACDDAVNALLALYALRNREHFTA